MAVLLLMVAVSMALAVAAPARAPETTYRGTAIDVETRKTVFIEKHAETWSDGRLISMRSVYQDPAGKRIAERTLDYSASDLLPDYRLEDFRMGRLEGAEKEGGGIRVFYREKAGRPLKEKRLVVPEPAVVDGGFNAILKRNWDRLGEGKRIAFNVVVPSRQAYYRFVAYEDKGRSKPGRTKVFIAVPQNALIRLAAPRIVVTYDVRTRRMIGFKGISNVPRSDGGHMTVRLAYPEGGP